MRGNLRLWSRGPPISVIRHVRGQISKPFHGSRGAKPLIRASPSFSTTSSFPSPKPVFSASSSSSYFGVVAGLLSGCLIGIGFGFIAGKYPFLSFQAGLKQKPEVFIVRPDERRATEDGEKDAEELDRFLKICEAVMKLAEIAILSSVAVVGLNAAEAVSSSQSEGEPLLPQNTLETVHLRSSTLAEPAPPLPLPSPESRPVYPFPVDPGIPHVHFSTNKLSRKFRQLASNPEVTLTYLDKQGAGYVTVKGEAEILSAGQSAALWRDELILYYSEGPPSASSPSSRFVVVRIHPRRIEFCSSRFGAESAHDSWLPLALVRQRGRWTLAPENKIL